MLKMKTKIPTFLLLLFWPMLLSASGNCTGLANQVLDNPVLKILRDRIEQGKIRYTRGARQIMEDRGVTEDNVENILRQSQTVANNILSKGRRNGYYIGGYDPLIFGMRKLKIIFDFDNQGFFTIISIKVDRNLYTKLDNGRYKSIDRLPLADFKHALRDYIDQGKIHYSDHALQRMRKHNIDERNIENILLKSEAISNNTRFDGERNGYSVEGFISQMSGGIKELNVIFDVKTNGTLKIITVERRQ